MATPTTRLKLKKQALSENLNTWGLSNGINGVIDQVDVLAGIPAQSPRGGSGAGAIGREFVARRSVEGSGLSHQPCHGARRARRLRAGRSGESA